ncbi:MAG TPA: N-acetyltransferase [Verrucomicrobiales bacterium]|nr:N-acetyltransferase [Verrucomicrobiales bacterium]
METRPLIVQEAAPEDIPTLRGLAEKTWWSHYPGILSHDQIVYMLRRMYDPARLREEMETGLSTYFLARLGTLPVGFAAVGPTPLPEEFKLHKLYVHPGAQRRGIGRQLLHVVESMARAEGARRLILCVNRGNAGALAAYARYGFIRREEVNVDIGGGFRMEDYVMVREIGSQPIESGE